MRGIGWICGLTFLVLAAGCGSSSSYRAPDLGSAAGPVAVVPFESLSGEPNAGQILADLVQAELTRRGSHELIPRETAQATLLPLEGMQKTPAELGEALGATTLLLGSVTEYRYKRGVGEEPVIGVQARLVDCASGRVLWNCTLNRIGRYSWFQEDSLSRLAHAVAEELVESLTEGEGHGR